MEVTKSLSNYREGTTKIIKSGFISFSEQKKEIVVIDSRNPNIIGRSKAEHLNDSEEDNFESIEVEQAHHEQLSRDVEIAKEEAARLGYEEGYQEGYQEGNEQGRIKGYQEGHLEALQVSEAELSVHKEELEKNYRKLETELMDEVSNYKKALEPKVALIIERLVRKLIGIQEVNRETILFLIRNGLEEVESYGDLIIRVSSFDIDYVQANRNLIIHELSESIQVEILKDPNLKENECIIETDMGTIDSSLGTQMERLLRELRLIYESFRVE